MRVKRPNYRTAGPVETPRYEAKYELRKAYKEFSGTMVFLE